MAANNNLNPEWNPTKDPAESAGVWQWRKLVHQYLYELRGGQANLADSFNNFNSNISQTVNQKVNEFFNNNTGNLVQPPVQYGTHAARLLILPAAVPGYLFVETDRFEAEYFSDGLNWIAISGTGVGSFETRWTGLSTYDSGLNWIETSRNNANGLPPYPNYRWDGNNWNFLSGEFYRTQANLTTLANTFAPANSANGNDIGARVNVTDFHHQLQWQGNNGWTWGPDDDLRAGEGPILREVDPSPTTGWQLYAGNNNVTYLKSDGTLGNVNLPDLSGANSYFLRAGAASAGPAAAVVPLFVGNAVTGAVAAPTFTGDAQNFNTANFTANATGAAALVSPTSITPTGNINAPAFTGNNATGTISNNGTPPSLTRRAWFRR